MATKSVRCSCAAMHSRDRSLEKSFNAESCLTPPLPRMLARRSRKRFPASSTAADGQSAPPGWPLLPCLAARRRKGAPPARALANRTLPKCDTRCHDEGWRLSRAASVDGFVYDHRQPRPPAFQAQLPWRRPRPHPKDQVRERGRGGLRPTGLPLPVLLLRADRSPNQNIFFSRLC
jgi:hypothetical protein